MGLQSPSGRRNVAQNIPRVVSSLPDMIDDDALSFFQAYERVNRSECHKFLPGRLSSKAFKHYARLCLEECRNYDVVKKCILEYFGQSEQVCLNPFPTICGRESRTHNRGLNHMKDTHERRLL